MCGTSLDQSLGYLIHALGCTVQKLIGRGDVAADRTVGGHLFQERQQVDRITEMVSRRTVCVKRFHHERRVRTAVVVDHDKVVILDCVDIGNLEKLVPRIKFCDSTAKQ